MNIAKSLIGLILSAILMSTSSFMLGLSFGSSQSSGPAEVYNHKDNSILCVVSITPNGSFIGRVDKGVEKYYQRIEGVDNCGYYSTFDESGKLAQMELGAGS